jgi:hypothetical protein
VNEGPISIVPCCSNYYQRYCGPVEIIVKDIEMDVISINQTTDLTSLVGVKLTKQGRYHVGPCPFCGGHDRFVIKHTPKGDRWFCRNCGDAKYHTPIDYVMRRDHVDYQTALLSMDGKRKGTKMSIEKAAAQPVLALPATTWQQDAWRFTDEAMHSLVSTPVGKAGRDYLIKRGLHQATWFAHRLGFAFVFDPKMREKRPAIVLPWWDWDRERDAVTAIKYRFLENVSEGLRYSARAGSIPILYGLWSAISTHSTLLLVEGELNALSIWQCVPESVTCISFGSETGMRTEILRHLVTRYRKIIVWADDPQKALEIRSSLGVHDQPWQSPFVDNKKWDANQMLQERVLMDFLSNKLSITCLGKYANT